jgi:hypothetical protein
MRAKEDASGSVSAYTHERRQNAKKATAATAGIQNIQRSKANQ